MTIQIDDFYRSSNGDRGGWCGTWKPGVARCGMSPICPPADASLRHLWKNGWTALVSARRTWRCGPCSQARFATGSLRVEA